METGIQYMKNIACRSRFKYFLLKWFSAIFTIYFVIGAIARMQSYIISDGLQTVVKRNINVRKYYSDFPPIWLELGKARTDYVATILSSSENVDIVANNRIMWTQQREGFPILTLFTTFPSGSYSEDVLRTTFRLWASLAPAVKCVLFHSEHDHPVLLNYARSLGWSVHATLPHREESLVFWDLFQASLAAVQPRTPFIGYAPHNVVFTADLNTTLTYLSHVNWRSLTGQGLLLIGHSNNIESTAFSTTEGPIPLTFPKDIRQRVIGVHTEVTYMISTWYGFPFSLVPELRVGQTDHSKWLNTEALKYRIRSIDCSLSITALQLVDYNNQRTSIQSGSIGSSIVECVPYFTIISKRRERIYLYQRLYIENKCLNNSF